MLNRHETFGLESTLSGKTYSRTFKRALSLGYELELHYLWLSNVEQASRVCVAESEWAATMFLFRIFAVGSSVA